MKVSVLTTMVFAKEGLTFRPLFVLCKSGTESFKNFLNKGSSQMKSWQGPLRVSSLFRMSEHFVLSANIENVCGYENIFLFCSNLRVDAMSAAKHSPRYPLLMEFVRQFSVGG